VTRMNLTIHYKYNHSRALQRANHATFTLLQTAAHPLHPH
jgi:hypothetical protein